MTMHETRAEYIRRIADDGAGGLATSGEIEIALDVEYAKFGQVTENIGDLPTDAHIRARGLFTDPQDMREYLERGGLVSTSGGEYQPLSWVWILKSYSDLLQEYTYQVFIRDTSD